MPRAEPGSTKHLSNQLKSKGLQRLRWYCQACSRQMRDENGFKCHVASESHVRNMMLIGEDPRKAINEFSAQFLSDFVKLLRTGHGEKKINVNHFYQEYIANKEHVHMNATKWASLTEFAKYLGREGICRVEEEDADENGRGGGLMIRWVDNSPDALRRQDALKKRERQDRGDEEREWRGIREQIKRARREDESELSGGGGDDDDDDGDHEARMLQRKDGERIKLSFGAKKGRESLLVGEEKNDDSNDSETKPDDKETVLPSSLSRNEEDKEEQDTPTSPPLTSSSTTTGTTANTTTITITATNKKPITTTAPFPTPKPKHQKPANPLAALTKKKSKPQPGSNVASSLTTNSVTNLPTKPMSQAERIMREEIERRNRKPPWSMHGAAGRDGVKRQRVS